MLALLDTSHDLDECAEDMNAPTGQLLTPLTRYRLRDPSKPWAIDNGAFSRFDENAYLSLLARESHHKENCLFVTVPDVVGSARRTLEIFDLWVDRLNGWNVALVAQDGQEDLPIPWGKIGAVFIGGSTKFKVSDSAAQIVRAAKILGKWVHVGRVNDPARYDYFQELAADSCDGTGLARYTHMRQAIANRKNQSNLFVRETL